jgi:hypothetical protein
VLVHVDTRTFVLNPEDTEAVLEDMTFDAQKIRGVDTGRMVLD